jgi:hypothetical protein
MCIQLIHRKNNIRRQEFHEKEFFCILSGHHFLPSNFCLNLVLAIEFQNQTFLTVQLLKPFTIGHRAVLMSGFNFLYLQFSP